MAAADWDGYLIAPNATGDGVTRQILGTDHEGNTQTIRVIEERPLDHLSKFPRNRNGHDNWGLP